jgi:RNA polymerase sigma-70 factor (ECF subfamily)
MGRIGAGRLAGLFDEHAGALVLFARSRCARPEDVVQDAFLALARQPREPEPVVPWLYRVVRNGALMAGRAEARRRRREAVAAAPERTGAGAFEAADDRIDAARAARVLDELDPDDREVVVARIWGGLGFEAIARLQGCSTSSAHRRYRAALARIQERLGTPCCPTTPTSETA